MEFTKLKELKEKHQRFLRENGYNPEEFLYCKSDAESYTFYHIALGKYLTIRR